ncbi:tRNA (N6-isopentenyl adenosine(37)-C2)-methylthiotransferase MiaB [Olsenella sp. HMSC062G07]|uniref:tRNA (N6-isopentenyl adenosine(37)-C2)-methylthiotransferase MiaB n=1 Tax=Olsenella sp. HMSC062G07 TaxID=1739330 RepID=UPI0008A25519|nr:tRNA-2-methylthio-N(6)-dimethylallyladenosine synthase MiaB [Olsenella sp. HMSC062G07]
MTDQRSLIGKTYFVRIFGCQMNLHDAERVSGLLDSCGCIAVSDAADADVVVFMTCSVREKADTHLYGEASNLSRLPAAPSGRRVVAVGGCIAQREGANLSQLVPNVDVVFGTSALASLPELLVEALEGDGTGVVADTGEEGRGFSADLPSRRASSFHAWVPIMYGCNNFCTYCIVPYVRGRERARRMERVVDEVARLASEGVREVTLLGQNVNSYGRDLYGEPRFAELLRRVGQTGIERVRFTSSNPKDLSADTIRAMAEVPAVMPHLHLAVQSGSTRILKAMNRSYTREQYLKIVSDLRAAVPGIALSTDIIVGFPGETEKDFADTLSLVSEVGFSSAYTFIYSRRPGTPAAKIADDTPRDVIQGRFGRLAQVVEDCALAANQGERGAVVEVLVEGASKRDERVMVGHSPKNQTVLFALPADRSAASLAGTLCDVRVKDARPWFLRGSLEGEPR